MHATSQHVLTTERLFFQQAPVIGDEEESAVLDFYSLAKKCMRMFLSETGVVEYTEDNRDTQGRADILDCFAQPDYD